MFVYVFEYFSLLNVAGQHFERRLPLQLEADVLQTLEYRFVCVLVGEQSEQHVQNGDVPEQDAERDAVHARNAPDLEAQEVLEEVPQGLKRLLGVLHYDVVQSRQAPGVPVASDALLLRYRRNLLQHVLVNAYAVSQYRYLQRRTISWNPVN